MQEILVPCGTYKDLVRLEEASGMILATLIVALMCAFNDM